MAAIPASRRLVALLGAALLALALAACGGDAGGAAGHSGHAGGGGRAGGAADPGERDRAFLRGMADHHASAIEMARIAERRGEDRFVRGLAGDILSAQRREVAQMGRIHERRFRSALEPDPAAHDALGLSAADAGMDHGAADNEQLRSADPFDREFVDMMSPHHAGAIRMSEAVLSSTEDPEVRALAEAIIEAQRREIAEMNRFREARFGGPVPDGGGHGGGHSGY